VGSRASTIIRSIHCLAAGLCLAVWMAAVDADAAAHTAQGGVRGAVRDANGVVPGAEVGLNRFPQFVRQQDHNASAMLSLGGGPRRANSYLLDGGPIGDIFNRAVIQPSIEALEEVKIQVSTYDEVTSGRTGHAYIGRPALSAIQPRTIR
jgi:hypothetical protein